MKCALLLLFLAITVAAPSTSWAWDSFYDGSVLPNDSSLGIDQWRTQSNPSTYSTDGDVLRVSGGTIFEKTASSGPFTLESRVRVAGARDSAHLHVAAAGIWVDVYPYSEWLDVAFDNGPSLTEYDADLTTFHTLRIAVNSQGCPYVWLDQLLVSQGVPHLQDAGQYYLAFGGGSATSTSYWDYVAYSKAFLPIPEPSSLLALLCGLAGLGAAVRRRRV